MYSFSHFLTHPIGLYTRSLAQPACASSHHVVCLHISSIYTCMSVRHVFPCYHIIKAPPLVKFGNLLCDQSGSLQRVSRIGAVEGDGRIGDTRDVSAKGSSSSPDINRDRSKAWTHFHMSRLHKLWRRQKVTAVYWVPRGYPLL